jgi:hypothetical protein
MVVGISQSELDKLLAAGRKQALPGAPEPEFPAPKRRKPSGPRRKKSPPCVITQDELDRILGRGES